MNWFRQFWDPRNPVQKYDRYQSRQSKRWVCGISIDDNLQFIRGCLLQASGAGKLLKLVPGEFFSLPISESLRHVFANIASPLSAGPLNQQKNQAGPFSGLPAFSVPGSSIEDYLSVKDDLTSLAVNLVSHLQGNAGGNGESILGVSIHHSGLYSLGDEGQWTGGRYLPLLDANQLAYQTGMNVLDQFPSKQLSDGGSPWPLSALPLWMLCADRSEPVARENRVIVDIGDWIQITALPPSDGYDGEFPEVRQWHFPGLSALNHLISEQQGAEDLGHLAAPGKCDHDLIDKLRHHYDVLQKHLQFNRTSFAPLAHCHQQFQDSVADADCCLPDLIQSFARLVCDLVEETTCDWLLQKTTDVRKGKSQKADGQKGESQTDEKQASRGGQDPEQQRTHWILAGDSGIVNLVASIAGGRPSSRKIDQVSKYQCPNEALGSVVAATMGFFHFDQLPCSLPWITGCQAPRILGALTPGSPARWRKLLLDMSDYRPPAMKLKDAV